MIRLMLLMAVLSAGACKGKKSDEVQAAPAAAEAPAPKGFKGVTPAAVKKSVEAAEQKNEERIDKRFDEAQKSGQ